MCGSPDEICLAQYVVRDFGASCGLFTNVGVGSVSESLVWFRVVSVQKPVEQGAGVAVGSDGRWHQDHVVSFYEAHDLVSTVGNASLFVGFAVAAELLLLSFPQTQE